MTVERSKRRCFLTLTSRVKSVSENLLIQVVLFMKLPCSHERADAGHNDIFPEVLYILLRVVASQHARRNSRACAFFRPTRGCSSHVLG